MGLLLTGISMSMFFSGPTGNYFMTSDRYDGITTMRVREDIRFAPDRTVYIGEPEVSWELYMRLTYPPVVEGKDAVYAKDEAKAVFHRD